MPILRSSLHLREYCFLMRGSENDAAFLSFILAPFEWSIHVKGPENPSCLVGHIIDGLCEEFEASEEVTAYDVLDIAAELGSPGALEILFRLQTLTEASDLQNKSHLDF